MPLPDQETIVMGYAFFFFFFLYICFTVLQNNPLSLILFGWDE